MDNMGRKVQVISLVLITVLIMFSFSVAASETGSAEQVINYIEKIGAVTVTSEDDIILARNAYDALEASEKVKVTNYENLLAAENALARIKSIDNSDVDAMVELAKSRINAIGEVTKKSGDKIFDARITYDALTDAQKELIYAPQLAEAEKAYEEIIKQLMEEQNQSQAKVLAVRTMIDSIGTVNEESGEVIKAAREAFDQLTDVQKKQTGNEDVLIAAEEAYVKLNEKKEEDKAAAKAVEALIDEIGKVTRSSGKAIREARNSYDALDKDQKALVQNLDVLEVAEKKYEKLMEKEEENDDDEEERDEKDNPLILILIILVGLIIVVNVVVIALLVKNKKKKTAVAGDEK